MVILLTLGSVGSTGKPGGMVAWTFSTRNGLTQATIVTWAMACHIFLSKARYRVN
jgi:hypothetical protein